MIKILLCSILFGVFTGLLIYKKSEEINFIIKDTLLLETFIQDYLLQDDGRIRTNLTDSKDIYLSETVGLWMEYLVIKEDFIQFDQQVDVLEKYFFTEDFLVSWELQGMKKAPANAFIDDLRIIESLYRAGELWNHTPYIEMADNMGKGLVRYQREGKLMVDHVDFKSKDQGSDISLSYIIPSGFHLLEEHGYLSDGALEAIKIMLVNAVESEVGFYPKIYNIPSERYLYAQEVNLIDQLYIGYHRAQWKGDVSPLANFIKNSFVEEGKLFGRYDSTNGKPIVLYESVAVYGLAILMFLEIEDIEFAKDLYNQMKSLQQDDVDALYFGGYIDPASKEMHIFDNLLALIAERRGLDEYAF